MSNCKLLSIIIFVFLANTEISRAEVGNEIASPFMQLKRVTRQALTDGLTDITSGSGTVGGLGDALSVLRLLVQLPLIAISLLGLITSLGGGGLDLGSIIGGVAGGAPGIGGGDSTVKSEFHDTSGNQVENIASQKYGGGSPQRVAYDRSGAHSKRRYYSQ